MPVEFFTEEQQRRYGCYPDAPSPLQLARSVHFADRDHQLLARPQRDHTRWGFALQLGTVRFLGTVLPHPTSVPATVVTYVAQQRGSDAPPGRAHYHSRDTPWDHATEIQKNSSYRAFHDPRERFRLLRWLYSRAWLSAERPRVLVDLATARVVERKVLRPGVTTLARLVARVRDRCAARLWQRLAQVPTAGQKAKLEMLLHLPEGAWSTPWDRLRRAPTRVSGPALVAAWHRLAASRRLGVGDLSREHLPLHRRRAGARYGAAARAHAIARLAPERRTATLLAFAQAFERTAMDDALDWCELLVTDIVRGAHKEGEQTRLRTLHALAAAALHLWEALPVLLEQAGEARAIRPQTFARVSRARLLAAGAEGDRLTRPPDDNYYAELVERYHSVRRFVPTLGRTVAFEGTQAGQPRLKTVPFLSPLAHQRHPDMPHAPLDGLPSAWRRLVKPSRAPEVARRA